MNETPETDALAQLLHNKCSHSESCYYEMRIHARQLERERDAERALAEQRGRLYDTAVRQLKELQAQVDELERERDEARNEISKWHQMAVEADKRFVEALRERDLEQLKQQP